jgi:hypothetical protein
MKKNGRTAAGAQRWKCPECRVGATAPNRRQAMLRQLGSFVARLLGGHTLREEGRSFRRGTAWCWQVDPVIPLPEAKSHVLEMFWFNCFLWFWSGSFFGFGRGAC